MLPHSSCFATDLRMGRTRRRNSFRNCSVSHRTIRLGNLGFRIHPSSRGQLQGAPALVPGSVAPAWALALVPGSVAPAWAPALVPGSVAPAWAPAWAEAEAWVAPVSAEA